MKSAQRYVGLLAALGIYLLLLSVRPTIPLSDITRIVAEFNAFGMSDYNLREPLYWASGKILTDSLDDAWGAVFILDLAALAMVCLALRGRSLSAIAMIALILSPMILLGICNIHRQLVGFAAWLLIERLTDNSKPTRAVALHAVPFLIHNSMGILSLIYFFVQACSRRNYLVILGLIFFVLTSLLFFGGVVTELFRQGTETNIGLTVYFFWSIVIYAILILAVGWRSLIAFFYLLGVTAGIALFVFSGGSSGSRFLMLVITVCSVWLFSDQSLTSGSARARALSFALAGALVLPTLISDFSLEILRSAYYGRPFGLT